LLKHNFVTVHGNTLFYQVMVVVTIIVDIYNSYII
jgi:hypothetical protein